MSDETPSATTEGAAFNPLVPSLKAGITSGVAGFLLGGGVGTLRSAHPGLVAAFTGSQFFVLGSSFYLTREVLLHKGFAARTRKAETVSSTAAGALSGAVAGRFYGKVNSVAGGILVCGLSFLGQKYIHKRADQPEVPHDPRSTWDKFLSSKWVPLKELSNHEYEALLEGKLLKVDAEILTIDEKISALRESDAFQPATGKGSKS